MIVMSDSISWSRKKWRQYWILYWIECLPWILIQPECCESDEDEESEESEENEESESDQGVADLLGILDSKIEGKE